MGKGDPVRGHQAGVIGPGQIFRNTRSAKSTGVAARYSHHPLIDARPIRYTLQSGAWLAAIGCNSIQDGVPSWRWRTDHEVRCPRSPAPSHEDGRAAFDRRVRRCRVPAGPPGYGAGKLRCGQGNDAGILDLPWKIEWGYY